MKKILLLFCLLSTSIIYSQKIFELSLYGGVPVYIENTIGLSNFCFEGGVNKLFSNNLFTGIGLSYSNINRKPTINQFTYDRVTFTPFLTFGKTFSLKNIKLAFSPQIKAGYSFYSYSLNEFEFSSQNNSGFFSALGTTFKYKLTHNLTANILLFYNVIFSSYNNNIDFPIPDIYIKTSNNYIDQLDFGIGISYYL